MNFLEICQRVNTISGMHGTMTDVTSSKDFQKNIAQGVRDAWLSIQTYRPCWSFMHKKWEDFYVYEGRFLYPLAGSIDSPPVAAFPSDFGSHIKHGGLVLEERELQHITPREYHLTKNTTPSKPSWWTFSPSTNDIHIQLPDGTYNIDFYYQRKPQELLANTDVPHLPASYHNVILYGGLVNFAIFIGNPELYGKYDFEYKRELGNLMRAFIPSKKIQSRSLV